MKFLKYILILFLINISFITISINEKKFITVIIPCFNEEKNIEIIYNELINILSDLKKYEYELLFIDDGSSDFSWSVLKEIANKDHTVKLIRFTRNFGHQIALAAGYDLANGEAILSIDCDMQDPPFLIPKFLDKWERGFKIIYGRRLKRNEGFFKKVTANLFYKVLNIFSDFPIPCDVGDFRLIDRQVLEVIKKMPERGYFIRGIIAWTGFSNDFVDYVRPERVDGKSNYTIKKMFTLAFDGIFLNSSRFAYSLLIFLIILSFLVLIISLFKRNNYLYSSSFFIFFVFILLIFFLIISEYILRTYDFIKDRPLYVIEEKVNFE